MGELKKLYNPFPGLRPFKTDESHLFFGRDQQIHEILTRLRQNHFLAVLGTSGSGKSSLIRAGLLPALKKGLASKENCWSIIIFRPGGNPIGNLTEELYKTANIKLGPEFGQEELKLIILETNLRRSALGLVEVARQSGVWKKHNLLIVVDQFEELFRYKEAAQIENYADESAAFVKLLLTASNQKEMPIFILITMRSEFLGDCSQFRDLPETINDSLYLVPRMTRDQLREAITGPISVSGAEISNRLVQRMLNDIGEDPDQLPILQHALMRAWDYWYSDHIDNEPIDLRHYVKIGELNKALTNHAEEALEELIEENSKIVAQKVFQCITVKGAHNQAIRRPTKMEDIYNVIGVEEKDVIPVIENFRKKGRSFLMPPSEIELNQKSVIDISHESLIRKWPRLKKWVKQETSDKLRYLKLVSVARAHKKGEERLLRDPQLQIMLNWRKKSTPTSTWAQRYHQDYDLAMNYLDKSKKKRRIIRIFLLVCMIILLGISAKLIDNRTKVVKDKLFKQIWNDAVLALDNGDWLLSSHKFAKAALESNDPQNVQYSKFSIQNLNKTMALEKIINNGNAVKGISLSHEERILVTWDSLGTVKLWDNLSGNCSPIVMTHKGKINGAAFSEDDELILTWSDDKTAQLWHVKDGTLMIEMNHDGMVKWANFHPNKNSIITWSDDGMVRLWNVKNRSIKNKSMMHNRYKNPIISKKNGYIITWVYNLAYLWKIEGDTTAANVLKHNEPIDGAVFSNDDKYVLTWSRDNSARLWFTENCSLATSVLKHNGNIDGAIFTNNNKFIITWCDDGLVRLWQVKFGVLIDSMKQNSSLNGAVISKNDSLIVTWSEDKIIQIVRRDSNLKRLSFERSQNKTIDALFVKKDKVLITLSENNYALLWDTFNGTQISQPIRHGSKINGAISNRYGNLIISWSDDATIRIWRILDSPIIIKHNNAVLGAKFSENEDIILTWDFDIARLWHTKDGSPASSIMKHRARILNAVFSEDENLILTCSYDSTAHLWYTKNGLPASTKLQHNGIRGGIFIQDSTFILTWSVDSTAKLWCRTNDSFKEKYAIGHDGVVTGAFYCHDQDLIFTCSENGEVILSNAKNGNMIHRLVINNNGILGIECSEDERLFLILCGDSTVQLRDMKSYSQVMAPIKHKSRVRGAKFVEEKNSVLTWSDDATAYLWNTEGNLPVLAKTLKHDGTINYAEFNKYLSLIVTCSQDKSAQIWHARYGTHAIPRLRHNYFVNGASFSKDAKLLITWSDDTTARIWNVSTDYDFPKKYLPLLVEVITGTTMDDYGNISALGAEEWNSKKQKYIEIAEKHLKECKYKNANLFLKQKQVWQSN